MPPRTTSSLLLRRSKRLLRHARQAVRRQTVRLQKIRQTVPPQKIEFVASSGDVSVNVVKERAPDGIVSRLVSWYTTELLERPIKTNAVTQAVLCGLGDGIAQACEYKLDVMSPGKERYNYLRTARMAAYGFLVAGPIYSVWYRILDRAGRSVRVSYEPLFNGRIGSLLQQATVLAPHAAPLEWLRRLRTSEPAPVSALQLAGGKVVADGILGNSLILHAYFTSIGLLEGRNAADILANTREKFHNAWALAVLVWTPIQCINFYLVPLHLQAAFVAVANVGWSTTLSLLSHYKEFGSAEHRAELQRLNSDGHHAGEVERLERRVSALQEENGELRAALLALQAFAQGERSALPGGGGSGRDSPHDVARSA